MKKMTKFFTVFLSIALPMIAASDIQPVDHMTILGRDKVYTADQIDVLLQDAGKVKKIVAGQNITISPASGEGNVTINASGGSSSSKHIAMFIIPMNETSSTDVNNSFKHFELKASYNNFSPSQSGTARCCYYAHSGHADEAGILSNDKAMIFINHRLETSQDQRAYFKIPNTIEYILDYAPESYIVLVDASQCWQERSDGSWLDSESDNLMWTFVKTKNDEREIDAGTDHALWRPIAPVKWFSQLPNWATQN